MSTVTLPNNLPVPSTDTTALPPVSPPVAGSTSETTSSTSPNTSLLPATLKLDLGFQKLSLATLGIRTPNSPEDTAAILAEVAQLLDQTLDEARDKRNEALANALRTLLGDAGGLSPTASPSIARHITSSPEQKAAKTAERDAQASERSSKAIEARGARGAGPGPLQRDHRAECPDRRG